MDARLAQSHDQLLEMWEVLGALRRDIEYEFVSAADQARYAGEDVNALPAAAVDQGSMDVDMDVECGPEQQTTTTVDSAAQHLQGLSISS